MAQEDGDRIAFRVALGLNLKRYRRTLSGHSQETIAAMLGLNGDTVGSWERGITEPQAWELSVMAREYHVPGDWLLNPCESVRELDRRIAQLRRAAQEAARADAADELDPPGDGGTEPPPGRRLS